MLKQRLRSSFVRSNQPCELPFPLMSLGVLILLSGNVDVCTSNGNILIDNMRNGFDLYSPGRSTPAKTFKVDAQRRVVKRCVFAESGKAAVCGSDHGRAYVFGIDDEKPRQILRHGNAEQMIQAVEVRNCVYKIREHLLTQDAGNIHPERSHHRHRRLHRKM